MYAYNFCIKLCRYLVDDVNSVYGQPVLYKAPNPTFIPYKIRKRVKTSDRKVGEVDIELVVSGL